MSKKQKFVVEVTTLAVVSSKVIVEADSKAEALKEAKDVATHPYTMTDIDGNPIEGIGDLVWKYKELNEDTLGDIKASDIHVAPEGCNFKPFHKKK